MAKSESKTKCVAKCSFCGDVYAAMLSQDGILRPIGRAECTCGEKEFERITA